VLIATGATVAEAVKAAESLGGEGVSARVLDVHTVKPLDEEAVLAAASECRAVITVEDHSIHGGLGSAVAEVLSARGGTAPLRIIGMREFGESGTSEELYRKFGLDAEGIAATARDLLKAVG
jgi:transketolase